MTFTLLGFFVFRKMVTILKSVCLNKNSLKFKVNQKFSCIFPLQKLKQLKVLRDYYKKFLI